MKTLFAPVLLLWLILPNAQCLAQASEEALETFLTDYKTAVAKSNESGKPIFVYVFDSV